MRVPPPLTVPDHDALVLRGWIDGAPAGGTAARRANIVLLSGEGLGPTAISGALRCSKQTVITWRERYRESGVAGLRDAPRPGRPATVGAEALVRRTLDPPSGGARRWTTRTLGADLGVSNASVGHVWRTWGVTPAGPGRVELATDPVLDGRLAAVTGIHLGAAVRVLAARRGEPGGRTAATSDLCKLLAGSRVPTDGAECVEAFLRRIEGGATTVLIADGPVPDPPRGVVVHTAEPGHWVRAAQVACWIAEGGSAEGAASVRALGAALEDRSGSALSWVEGIGPARR